MLVFVALGITSVLSALALHMLWLSRRSVAGSRIVRLVASFALAGFAYLYGPWVFGSTYLREIFAAIWLLMLLSGALRKAKSRAPCNRSTTAFYAAFAAVLLFLDVLYFTGTADSTPCVDLRFPLKGERYFVLQGGKGLPANLFHYNNHHAVFAMDLVKLNSAGQRCSRIFSKQLDDYFIFGDTVYAPCEGTVVRAVRDNPDNIPPERKRGPHNLNGVVIEGAACTVFLGHMQQGKVFVNAGQQVVAGQPIGMVGNSGMSIEPHLHIQAHMIGRDGRPWYEQPQLFMRFDGKTYLLNENIRPSASLSK